DNAVERGFLGAHAAQTDLDHGKFLQNICVRSRGGRRRGQFLYRISRQAGHTKIIQRPKPLKPPMPPILPRLRMNPLGLRRTFFIIFCIISYWRSSLLTASTVWPEPAAMRRLRLGLMISGLARSAGVIE